jgi:hypothetical protein
LRDVASEIEVVRGCFRYVIRSAGCGALVDINAAIICCVDLIAPSFRASTVSCACTLADILAGGQTKAGGLIVSGGNGGITVGIRAAELAIEGVVDLRNYSVSRSPDPKAVEQPLELHRGFSQLNIYLPLGSPEGVYEVRIVTIAGDTLLNTGGTARLKDGVSSLQVRKKLSLARPGQCTMQIRKPPSAWSSYPLVLR